MLRGNFLAKIFAQCTLGGQNLQKTQKIGKTSKLSKFSKNVPKNIVWACFAWLFRRKNSLPSAPWRLKKVPQKWKRIQIFKNVQKRFQGCPNMFWCDFFEIFWPVHPGGSKLGKTSKNWKNFQLFKMPEKTFPKAIKHVLNMLRGSFLAKIFAQCNLESRVRKRLEKMENFNISKVSKTVPNIVQTCSEPVLRYFFRKKVASAPWRVEAWKKLKKNKSSKFSKFSKNVPKNIVWACFAWLFRRKKALPSEPWRLKKMHKNRKDFKNSKSRKTLSKVFKLAWGSFFELFLPSATWRSKFVKLARKNRKKIEFSKVSKNKLESLHTSFELVFRQFFRKKVPSAPCRVNTWKNFKKLEKLSIFQNA